MAYQKRNNLQVKEYNKKAILRQLRVHKKLQRRDLANATGLTPATITNLVNELIAQNMVAEGMNAPSTGGRKPTFLQLNPAAGFFVGIELSSAAVTGVLTDFFPTVLDTFTHSVDFTDPPPADHRSNGRIHPVAFAEQ